MLGGTNLTGGSGFKSKPKALMCYICGNEYGTASLNIHIKSCMKKWEIEESKKPPKERRPIPQPPKDFDKVIDAKGNIDWNKVEDYNKQADAKWNDEHLVKCENCHRTFLPERIPAHQKICTKEKPMNPLKKS